MLLSPARFGYTKLVNPRLALARASLHLAPDGILGRTSSSIPCGVEGIYDRYNYLREKREAFDCLATSVERGVNPPSDNVVPLCSLRYTIGALSRHDVGHCLLNRRHQTRLLKNLLHFPIYLAAIGRNVIMGTSNNDEFFVGSIAGAAGR
jgi:hypothetical protein